MGESNEFSLEMFALSIWLGNRWIGQFICKVLEKLWTDSKNYVLAIIVLDLNIWCKPIHFPILRPHGHTQWFKEEQSEQRAPDPPVIERAS